MKASELRDKNSSELNSMLLDLRKEQFSLRMQHGTGQLGTPHDMRRVRKEIARVKTVLNQKQDEKQA
ncbi:MULTISPECIES: 50S ribosomal protein L29 [unclassified Wenzhouxiangella]|uniref:50S ribosomal protein L29 n=1 Tax=unclassified Wenzhouxiangella TaxID=2613841 RepID=UPI000E32C3F7|nr:MULTISPECIES: 50S ribosomal protein L29 [unclassified Wenzhouxiangella]RFF26467.1 50S ribosomal protein L29 [Wenzhouxiangella sp. 15181]RFP67260.1 50S ribosomal protein L29 [Wenzhouxiangella sp. 15190]